MSLKTTVEALCAAQSALNERAYGSVDVDRVPVWVEHLQELINEVERSDES